MEIWVVATHIFFIFTPNFGEDEPILTHIFQMGWFNHQLEIFIDDYCQQLEPGNPLSRSSVFPLSLLRISDRWIPP